MSDIPPYATKICDARLRVNLTQKQLAEAIGVSQRAISQYECGNRFPQPQCLLPLTHTLDLSLTDLLNTPTNSASVSREAIAAAFAYIITHAESHLQTKERLTLTAYSDGIHIKLTLSRQP